VKLLFDQNLSRRLVAMFSVEYPESSHVTEVGLERATDAEIWSHAGEHGFVIVSKDSDFRQLAFLYGPPPKALGEARQCHHDRDLRRVAEQLRRDRSFR
jgi:predicted nuclease of predicted toxin-antitoxin system